MGEVVQMVSRKAAEDAWEAYASHARRILEDNTLLLDRVYMEETWRRQRVAMRLFGRLCG